MRRAPSARAGAFGRARRRAPRCARRPWRGARRPARRGSPGEARPRRSRSARADSGQRTERGVVEAERRQRLEALHARLGRRAVAGCACELRHRLDHAGAARALLEREPHPEERECGEHAEHRALVERRARGGAVPLERQDSKRGAPSARRGRRRWPRQRAPRSAPWRSSSTSVCASRFASALASAGSKPTLAVRSASTVPARRSPAASVGVER